LKIGGDVISENSFHSLLSRRKTTRKLVRKPLEVDQFKELVWAAFGNTHVYRDIKMRTAPSAGATYPIEIYFVLEDVKNMADGLYSYSTSKEEPTLVNQGKYLDSIRSASLDQKFISEANLAVLMVYNPDRILPEYGENSFKYALLECGHIAQNLQIMATELELGSVPVGAFDERTINKIIGAGSYKETLYMVIIGASADK
jgi:SagB-type dehydrogenase family enzyme